MSTTDPDAIVTFRYPDGTTVRGTVQGNGGVLRRSYAAARLGREMRLARRGRPLTSYEPKPGHIKVCNHPKHGCYGAAEGLCVAVDLRLATVVGAE
jgi:hypothetical protein